MTHSSASPGSQSPDALAWPSGSELSTIPSSFDASRLWKGQEGQRSFLCLLCSRDAPPPRAWPPQSNPSGARHRPPPRRPGVSWAPPPRRPCYPSCVQLGAPGEKKWHGPEGRARERMNDGCVCTGCGWRVALRGLGRLAPAGLVGASTPPHPAGQGCEQTTPSSINPPARDPRKLGG